MGCDCFPLPMGPSNAAPVCRINRKGGKAWIPRDVGCDPTLRPHSSLGCAEPREWEGKGRGDFFSLGRTCHPKQPEKGKTTFAPGLVQWSLAFPDTLQVSGGDMRILMNSREFSRLSFNYNKGILNLEGSECKKLRGGLTWRVLQKESMHPPRLVGMRGTILLCPLTGLSHPCLSSHAFPSLHVHSDHPQPAGAWKPAPSQPLQLLQMCCAAPGGEGAALIHLP